MIFIGLGANLPSKSHGMPRETLLAALDMLKSRGISVVARSRCYESAPIPRSEQPWFVNTVAVLETLLAPAALLRTLHDVEAALGRVRADVVNAPRAADLDLLDYRGQVSSAQDWPRLPHPRMHERAFVLRPLAELAPAWRHPISGRSADELLAALDPCQPCNPLPEPPAMRERP